MAPVLGYWDIRGLAQPIRYLLNYVGAEYEDKRYSIGPAPDFDKSQWLSEKPNLGLDFPNLPYYIDGDVKITQSLAIIRYLARKYKLVGESEQELIRSDVTEQQVMDLKMALVRVCYNAAEYEKAREEHLKTLPGQMELLSKFLGSNKYVLGDKLTYVDFLLYELLDVLLVYEPTCLDATGNLKEYVDRIREVPELKKYLESDAFKKQPLNGPMAAFGGQPR